MMKLVDYLTARYKDGARGEDGYYDCWGLTRDVRHFVYGKPRLLEFAGANRFTPITLAKAANKQTAQLEPLLKPVVGAVIGVYKKDICHHVAVAVENNGKIEVLDINPQTGVRLSTLKDFTARFYGHEVRFYD